jgi:hypothetical protein
MREIADDLFSLRERGRKAGRRVAISITTNGVIKANGEAVMGRGIALHAANRWPEFPRLLAEHLRANGNVTAEILPGIFAFPTKHDWRDASDRALIAASARRLVQLSATYEFVFLTRVGTGNGQLPWRDVEAVIDPILRPHQRFVVVTPNREIEKRLQASATAQFRHIEQPHGR